MGIELLSSSVALLFLPRKNSSNISAIQQLVSSSEGKTKNKIEWRLRTFGVDRRNERQQQSGGAGYAWIWCGFF